MSTLNLGSSVKQSRANAIATALGAACLIRIYSGTMPATADVEISSQTLLSTMTGNATAFAGSATISGVNGVTVGSGGSGYASAPTVAFTGGGGVGTASISGTTMTVSGMTSGGYAPGQTISGGSIAGGTTIIQQLTNTGTTPGGAGTYQVSSSQTVTSTTVTGVPGTTATATATISGGAVNAIIITNPGNGYGAAPTVTLTGGGYSVAASSLTAALGVVLSASAITQDSSAAGSGTPSFARLVPAASAAGVPGYVDVDCGAVGSGAAFQITPATITAGAPVTCSSFVIEEG